MLRRTNRRSPVVNYGAREGPPSIALPACRKAAAIMFRHLRFPLLSAGLALLGLLSGCQSARSRASYSVHEPMAAGSATISAPPAPGLPPEPPSLRGESVPIPGPAARRSGFPPATGNQLNPGGVGGGPSLNADSDESTDEEDLDDEPQDPIFPRTGSQPPRFPDSAGASNDPSARTTLSSSTRAAKSAPGSEGAARYPLPVARRVPSLSASRDTSEPSEPAGWSTSLPIPLANPPRLLTPPTSLR